MPSEKRNVNAFTKLTDFLLALEKRHIAYDLKHVRSDAIMVQVYNPDAYWEIEFFSDGTIEAEPFRRLEGVLLASEQTPKRLLREYDEAEREARRRDRERPIDPSRTYQVKAGKRRRGAKQRKPQ